jgi:hypothetical protein
VNQAKEPDDEGGENLTRIDKKCRANVLVDDADCLISHNLRGSMVMTTWFALYGAGEDSLADLQRIAWRCGYQAIPNCKHTDDAPPSLVVGIEGPHAATQLQSLIQQAGVTGTGIALAL